MRQIATITELTAALAAVRRNGGSVGLVPTMGALHDGHASLIRAAADAGNSTVVTTIFVNPLQFGPHEDLDKYPRDLDGDRALAAAAGATILFTPSVAEMYPHGPRGVLTNVSVAAITEVLDGLARPGHFDGVATVVAKLFAMTGECRAYFGEKDFQQLAVVRRMASDLSFPVEIVGCPTVREANGLARSSRNRYLSEHQRDRASVVYRSLQAGAAAIVEGETDPEAVCARIRSELTGETEVTSIDYAACVDPDTLQTPETISGPVRLLTAVRVGPARLIDNLGASPVP